MTTKSKKQASTDTKDSTVEGVVYKVSDTRIVLAVDSEDDLGLPERCRLVKLANSVTYDRWVLSSGIPQIFIESSTQYGSCD